MGLRASATELRRGASVPDLREIAGRAAPVALAGDQLLPVRPELEGLFPRKGLQRGTVIGIADGTGAGATSLLLALLAEPSAQGSWTAVVGQPALGALAAGELGVDLSRCALVPDPGPAWPTVVAALLDAIDVVVLHPPNGRAKAADARRLAARARERGSVLVVLGPWPVGADVRLQPSSATWTGLGDGHGALASRSLDVVATGRGAATRERRVHVALPAAPTRSGGDAGDHKRHMNAGVGT